MAAPGSSSERARFSCGCSRYCWPIRRRASRRNGSSRRSGACPTEPRALRRSTWPSIGLAQLLYPDEPARFVDWDVEGRLVLRASRPCLVRRGTDAALNDRERWLVQELAKRPAISSREYRAALAIPRATAHRDLEHLVSLGVLRR